MKKELYELVKGLGEGDYPKYHIIYFLDDETYRVYYDCRYCFEISRSWDEYGEYYHYFNDWEGFEKIDCEIALNLMK